MAGSLVSRPQPEPSGPLIVPVIHVMATLLNKNCRTLAYHHEIYAVDGTSLHQTGDSLDNMHTVEIPEFMNKGTCWKYPKNPHFNHVKQYTSLQCIVRKLNASSQEKAYQETIEPDPDIPIGDSQTIEVIPRELYLNLETTTQNYRPFVNYIKISASILDHNKENALISSHTLDYTRDSLLKKFSVSEIQYPADSIKNPRSHILTLWADSFKQEARTILIEYVIKKERTKKSRRKEPYRITLPFNRSESQVIQAGARDVDQRPVTLTITSDVRWAYE